MRNAQDQACCRVPCPFSRTQRKRQRRHQVCFGLRVWAGVRGRNRHAESFGGAGDSKTRITKKEGADQTNKKSHKQYRYTYRFIVFVFGNDGNDEPRGRQVLKAIVGVNVHLLKAALQQRELRRRHGKRRADGARAAGRSGRGGNRGRGRAVRGCKGYVRADRGGCGCGRRYGGRSGVDSVCVVVWCGRGRGDSDSGVVVLDAVASTDDDELGPSDEVGVTPEVIAWRNTFSSSSSRDVCGFGNSGGGSGGGVGGVSLSPKVLPQRMKYISAAVLPCPRRVRSTT